MTVTPTVLHEATFPHASHLEWDQLTERGRPLPGWVTGRGQVKAINEHITLRTYRKVVPDAPLPNGCSWENLDHCGGWHRRWHNPDGTPVDEADLLTARVLAGEKVAGSAHPLASDATGLDRILAAVDTAPGYVATVNDSANANFRYVWIAPDKHLGDVVDLDPIIDFYESHGINARALSEADDIYLPALGTDYAFDTPYAEITGLILGYPPASTLSILLHD